MKIFDVAGYAPAVALAFVWFALGACGDPISYSVPNPAGFGAIQVEKFPDYTQYQDGASGTTQCNENGTHRDGGDNSGGTRAALQADVDRQKSTLQSLKVQSDSCKRVPEKEIEEAAKNRKYHPCSFDSKNQRLEDIKDVQNKLNRAEDELDRFNACMKDRDRKLQAQGRPQIDPAAVLGIMQGLQGYGGRRPPQGTNVPSGGHSYGNHKH